MFLSKSIVCFQFLKRFFDKKKLFWINNVFLGSLASFSIYSITQNFKFTPNIENNYFFRIQLGLPDNSNNLKIENKIIDLSKSDVLNQTIKTNAEKLEQYYKKYSDSSTFVNRENYVVSDNSDQNKHISFYVHQKSLSEFKNLNRKWMDLIKLNQLSIDRYGYEYDESGSIKADSNKEIRPIVKWHDISNNSLKITKGSEGKESLEFYFYNNDISETDIKILTNKDKEKYKTLKDSDANTATDDVTNNWFVWLDKDVLSIKLNYIFHTWLFNQSENQSKSFVTDIIQKAGATDEEKKQLTKNIKENYETLLPYEIEFAKNYHDKFWKSGKHNIDSIKTDNFITSQDLNKIYNTFVKNSQELVIFQNHLIQVIEPGKEEIFNTLFNGHDKMEFEKPKKFAATKNNNDKPNKINININKTINVGLKNSDLFELLKNYSIKEFEIKKLSKDSGGNIPKDLLWSAGIYSTSVSDKFNENINIFKIPKITSQKINIKFPWLFLIAFIFLCGIVVSHLYKIPGLIGFLNSICCILSTVGILFYYGIELSMNVIAALVMLFFYAFIHNIYHLNKFQNILKKDKLPKISLSKTNKKSFVFLLDSTLIFFTFSSLISFFAPIHLREFGIALSLGIFIFLFLWTAHIFGNLSHFISHFSFKQKLFKSNNFLYMDNKYENNWLSPEKERVWLSGARGYMIFLLGFMSLGILLLIINVQFNSLEIFKKSYLFTANTKTTSFKTDKSTSFQLDDIIASFNNVIFQKIPISTSNNHEHFYLASGNLDVAQLTTKLNESLLPKSFSIQETYSYSEIDHFWEIFKLLNWIFLVISVHLFLRFGFINLMNLLVSTIGCVLIYFAFLLITRFWVDSNFNLLFMSLIGFVLFYILIFSHIFMSSKNFEFEQDKQTIIDYLKNTVVKNKIYVCVEVLLFILFQFLFHIVISRGDVAYFLIQISIIKFLVLVVFVPVKIFLWKILNNKKDMYYKLLFKNKNSSFLKNTKYSLNFSEEENISGINS